MNAQSIPSSNYDDRKGFKPIILVWHIGEGTKQNIINEFLNPKTEKSSHYLICRDGSLIQFVDENLSAWANGIVWKPRSKIVEENYLKGVSINKISISVEAEGFSYQEPTEAYYKTAAALAKEINFRWKIPLDGEHQIPHRFIRADKTCPARISVGKILDMANAPVPTPQIQPITPTPTPQIQPNTNLPMWMQNFLYRNSQKLGAFLGFSDPIFGGVPRSSHWNKFRNDFLKVHPFCEACGVRAETAHHILPYSVDNSMELIENNIIALCNECHLVLAHLKSFRRYEKDIREVAKAFRTKVEEWS